MSNQYVAGRVLGTFPISIATSLAIEGGLGVHPENGDTKNYFKEINSLWINLRTLFRNFYNAIDKDAAPRINPRDIADGLLEEMEMIKTIVGEKTNNQVKVIFYYSNYQDLASHFKLAVLRTDNTPKQLDFAHTQEVVIKYIFEMESRNPTHDIRGFKLHLKNDRPDKSLIITHYPIDLLSSGEFIKLSLLESHTGKVRQKNEWWKKFCNGKDLIRIPFTPITLQIFGDNELFKPLEPGIRKTILEMAEKYSWSQLTTYDKIKYGIESMKDIYARKRILDAMTKW